MANMAKFSKPLFKLLPCPYYNAKFADERTRQAHIRAEREEVGKL